MAAINHVLVVGGGTAGWLTACLLAATHNRQGNSSKGLQITLVESATVTPIGVGEGTWPTMRATLQRIGITESQIIQHASATFKQASKFVNWHSSEQQSHYYHPFSAPQGSAKLDITPFWLQQSNQDHYAESVCFQPAICEQGLAPKPSPTSKNTLANYGYHFDAGKFVSLLQQHGTENLGIKRIIDDVVQVQSHTGQKIDNVTTSQNGTIEADVFIDCSGFKGLLIGEALNVGWHDCSDVLLADTALVTQKPYSEPHSPIKCYTQSTAQQAGWIWDIGLQNRRGVGYVYGSAFSELETAQRTLCKYLGTEDSDFRTIKFSTGYRRKFWQGNCVAIGLSSGFLEPLEASALMLIEQSALMLAQQLPSIETDMHTVANRFNQEMEYKWSRTIEFLKLHYVLSCRDEPFWRASRASASIPKRLAELLQEWLYRVPKDEDFDAKQEVFSAQSYRYVLYGMQQYSQVNIKHHATELSALADKQFLLNTMLIKQAALQLPSHRALIEQILETTNH